MKNVDVLVIGAGPSGAIASSYLNKQGFDVMVVEKMKFPRFVIGESLLPRCMDHLEEVGMLEEVKKAMFQRKEGAKFVWDNEVCEFEFAEQYTKGYTWTWQVQREKFDKLLIDLAQDQGVKVFFEHSVENVDFSGELKKTFLKDENGNDYIVQSKFVIDASGYGRVLPKLLDLSQPSTFEYRSATFARLKNHYKNKDRVLSKIKIDTLDDEKTWLWMIPFSDGTTSVGMVGKSKDIEACVENPKENYPKLLNKSKVFHEIFEKLEFDIEPNAIKGFSIGIKKMYGDGFVLCGNSTEFLDPVFSSGVTFAMESGMKAAKLVEKELNGEKVDWENDYSEYMKKGIDVFRAYVNGWYDGTLHTIFFTHEMRHDIKERICSVLAGYVWDESNPFVKKPKKVLENLVKVIQMG